MAFLRRLHRSCTRGLQTPCPTGREGLTLPFLPSFGHADPNAPGDTRSARSVPISFPISFPAPNPSRRMPPAPSSSRQHRGRAGGQLKGLVPFRCTRTGREGAHYSPNTTPHPKVQPQGENTAPFCSSKPKSSSARSKITQCCVPLHPCVGFRCIHSQAWSWLSPCCSLTPIPLQNPLFPCSLNSQPRSLTLNRDSARTSPQHPRGKHTAPRGSLLPPKLLTLLHRSPSQPAEPTNGPKTRLESRQEPASGG